MSLPSKPVLLPLINVQRHYGNWDEESEDDETSVENEEEMGMSRKWFIFLAWPSHSCILFMARLLEYDPIKATYHKQTP